jgi:hypothetical protein
MIILAYVWIFFIFLMATFLVVGMIVEKNFDESHPVKKWWRRNIIDTDPEDAKYKLPKDDIQE